MHYETTIMVSRAPEAYSSHRVCVCVCVCVCVHMCVCVTLLCQFLDKVLKFLHKHKAMCTSVSSHCLLCYSPCVHKQVQEGGALAALLPIRGGWSRY